MADDSNAVRSFAIATLVVAIAALLAAAFYFLPRFQRQSCDTPQALAMARALLANADYEKLNPDQTMWLDKNVQILVTNERSDDTGRHLTCTARVDVAERLLKDSESPLGLAMVLAGAAGKSIGTLTLHYQISAEAAWQSWSLFLDPQSDEERSEVQLFQVMLHKALPVPAATIRHPPSPTRSPAPHQIAEAGEFSSYVGKDMCSVGDALNASQRLKEQFISLFGKDGWESWTELSYSCGEPIQSIDDPSIGTLIVLQRFQAHAAFMNGAVLIKPDGEVSGICMVTDDGKSADWRGKGWQQTRNGEGCYGTDQMSDDVSPTVLINRMALARGAAHQ